MEFVSILGPDGVIPLASSAPDCFVDLRLDQVVAAITAHKEKDPYYHYPLRTIFYTPLTNVETIRFRQAVMQDIEQSPVLSSLENFSHKMRTMRVHLQAVRESFYEPSQWARFLDATEEYCEAVSELNGRLTEAPLKSAGLTAFREYLGQYVNGSEFRTLFAELSQIRSELAQIQYELVVRGDAITVRQSREAIDYTAELIDTFARFRQGEVQDYTVKLPEGLGMSFVDAQIVSFLTKLFPEPFTRLARFYQTYQQFPDSVIVQFDQEVQFYLAYVEYIAAFKHQDLPFCYPDVTTSDWNIRANDAYDLALAKKCVMEEHPVVTNDFSLADPERIFVVTGPNQGGKTTFARMVGQLHYLASLGCPVPGREARLMLPDQIYTHFERAERVADRIGKLQNDLERIHSILARATSRSLILLNEIFSSTSLDDATFLGKQILQKIAGIGAMCVIVTFIDELASLNDTVVSLVGTVLPDRPEIRTYRIVRQPADGLAYAIALAAKYRLTKEQLKERLRS
ncbi:MAG: DNA mismatch repair protein MutS [Firmicutes bacterium]|nr:DNA mismatch repair protein MutS [Bacillota bacterium]